MQVFDGINYIKAKNSFDRNTSVNDNAPLFRKKFYLDKVDNATIYVQGLGYAYFYINGTIITEDMFLSPQSNYNQILWYNKYDVSHLLKKGENVIAVICGNGWYNVCVDTSWKQIDADFRDNPKFILRLDVDGEKVVESNDSWRCSLDSFVLYNQVYSGEIVDFRKYDNEWTSINFDDSNWLNAVIDNNAPKGKFKECTCPPLREKEYFYPKKIYQNGNKYILDFGTNISGYVRANLKGECDAEIIIRHAEEITDDNNLDYNELDRFYPDIEFQTDRIILGNESVVYSPLFTYHGFRYIEVEGLGYYPEKDTFTAVFVRQDFDKKSNFSCSDEFLNFLYNAAIQSVWGNTHYALTDCPTREKLGWTNDAQASCEQTFINFHIEKFYEKWFEDVRLSVKDNGEMPSVVPSAGYGYNMGPVCDGILFEIPLQYYNYTGDSKMLIDTLPLMYKNYNFYKEQLNSENCKKFLMDWAGSVKLGFNLQEVSYEKEFIDWAGKTYYPTLSESQYENLINDWYGRGYHYRLYFDYVQRFFMLKYLKIIALAENLAGNNEKAKIITQERNELKKHLLDKYFSSNGICLIPVQAAVSMAIVEGVYSNIEILKSQLIAIIERDNFQNTCGMVGAQYLYDALSICNKADYAYKLLKSSTPGYYDWYKAGATTLYETWHGTGSHNHHMFSCVVSWLFKALLGITPVANKEIIKLTPRFISEINHCEGSVEIRGEKVFISWNKLDNGYLYKVIVPHNCTLEFNGKILNVGENVFVVNN